MIRLIALLPLLAVLAGCASGPRTVTQGNAMEEAEARALERRTEELNQRLLMSAAEAGLGYSTPYLIGPDDLVRIEVFGVEDLTRTVRVDNQGRISLPLAGSFAISGLGPEDAARVLERELGQNLLRNPRVTVSVEEHRSLQFTAVGAVLSPKTYTATRSMTLLEALGMAGGLSADAGNRINVTDRVRDPDSGELMTRTIFIDVDDLLSNPQATNMALGMNAIINVPRGGVVYIEGAVGRPGSITKRADTTVLGAVAMSGGLLYEANPRDVRLVRRTSLGQWETTTFNFNQIRDDPSQDVTLADGDVIIVGYSTMKRLVKDFNTFAIPGLVLFTRF